MVSRAIILCLTILLLVSCGEESDNATQSTSSTDGTDLMGLVDGATLTYLQIDTLITFTPSFNVETSETLTVVTVAGNGNDWAISHDNHHPLTLKLSSESVLITGYWKADVGGDARVYFAIPPVLLKQDISAEQSWSGYTPMHSDSLGEKRYPDIFVNYGFYFSKTYEGAESVTVTAGEFVAHRFDIELFLESGDNLPVAYISEYYAPDVGLIKYCLKGGGLTRVLSLIEID